jgi:3-oxoisoapionate kinase
MTLTPATFAFYGDDFTGSTDSLDMLAAHGVPVTLVPEGSLHRLDDLPRDAVIGVAGRARAMNRREMQAHLPNVFAALRAAGRSTLHYKVCSTFDSAPDIGNMTTAATLAAAAFGDGIIPVLGGAPALRRYCAFGNLFAATASDDVIHRLDRHPVMRHHPVTPMAEADLARHLTTLDPSARVATLTLPDLRLPEADLRALTAQRVHSGAAYLLIDALDVDDTLRFARLLSSDPPAIPPRVVIGGSSVEDALGRLWRRDVTDAPLTRVAQLLVLSASCSPSSALQIDDARARGFHVIDAPTAALLRDPAAALAVLHADATSAIAAGRSVVIHTCAGPADPRITATHDALADSGGGVLSERLGHAFAQLLDRLLRDHPLERVVLAGGDFSGNVIHALPIDALTFVARVTPGAPLTRIHAREAHLHGVEIALKGGQLGSLDYYTRLLGAADAPRRAP